MKSKNRNKEIETCVKKCKIFENTNSRKNLSEVAYKTEAEYQKSFDNILEFAKKFTKKEKTKINLIIYNDEKEDGLYSAYITWMFLKENNIENVEILPMKPASAQNKVDYRLQKSLEKIKEKDVIILDIAYSSINLKYIVDNAKSVLIIDDHPRTDNNSIRKIKGLENRFFIGDEKHATVAYTWKFFNPRKNVPLYAQYIDNSDRKLYLPYFSHDSYLKTYINFRIVHSPYIPKFNKTNRLDKLTNLWDIDEKFKKMVGYYYDQVENNIKEQVARNASFAYFQGHPVYVLNYNDPVITIKVGRQMISNAEKKGDKIHFAVLWGYEYTNKAYRVALIEKHHGQPRFNLPKLANTLARIGGHHRGGGGSKFLGNFYWPKNNKYDIWDLFTKTPTFLKNKKN